MKHLFALPALLRPALLLAAASQQAFSVTDDLLAFPQYDVQFSDDYVSERSAQAKVLGNDRLGHDGPIEHDGRPPSQMAQYHPSGHDQHGDSTKAGDVRLEYEHMMLDGRRFLCSIPQVKKAASTAQDGNETISKAEEERELARATDRGWELLSGMEGSCVYYYAGWWSYRFCYGQGVKQFHQLPPSRNVPAYPPVEDPGVVAFELGLYDTARKKVEESSDDERMADMDRPDAAESGNNALDVSEATKWKTSGSGDMELVQRGDSRYLVQRLRGGTKCDLTGKDRRTEVQFHCNPQSGDRISFIRETATCAYLMIVQTPRLCNDVAFLPPQKDQPNEIVCSPVLADNEVDDYERGLKAIKSAEREAKIWEATVQAAEALGAEEQLGYEKPLQMVGGIAIGGHALVPEDTKIEKSHIVGGGKETYVDTVASSDGRTLSEDEIKRLGLGDARAVKKLKKELEKMAKGQHWKLDVIDTPNGREYRGIIGDDEADDGKGKGAREGGKDGAKGANRVAEGEGDGDEDEEELEVGSQEEYYLEEL